MARTKKSTTPEPIPMSRPALTPETRENQLIALAVDRAEQQLRDGTASSQVICHYLKLGADKKKRELEQEILENQRELISAKTDNLRSQKKDEAFYERVMSAIKEYGGHDEGDEDA